MCMCIRIPTPLMSITANATAACSFVRPRHLKNSLNSFTDMKPDLSLSTA